METKAAIRLSHITKVFGRVIANRDVSTEINYGEILSLLGENGSGKTTLMNMLAGIYYPDAGQIYMDDREVSIRSPKDAFELGIGMIHQHFKLVDVFTAAENIILGLPEQGRINRKEIARKVREICDKYGFDLDPNQKVYEMSVSQKQTLEIVKVLYRGAKVLILDEPTAVLTPQETEKLFKIIRNMKADGKAIIIITHKLHEVLSVSDRVAILRLGQYVGAVPTKEATELSLTEMMVGKKVSLAIDRPQSETLKLRLAVRNLSYVNKDGIKVLDDINFELYGGEILGIAGISGCGQKELLECIAGVLDEGEGSSVRFYPGDTAKFEELTHCTPRQIREHGVALSFVPEDRLGMGLVGSMGIADNMMLKDYNNGHSFFTNRRKPRELAARIKEDLEIKAPDLITPVSRLSGGNVQKVLVGREIASAPVVLMTAYAVRGLDINSAYTIFDLLNQQKMKGVAVIYVGEDLDSLLELCARILVMCGGKVNGILDGRTCTKEQVGLLMTHMKKEEDAQ